MKYAAFLRGVNVAGQNTLPMADLRAAALALGFTDVQTVLQSGNLVFSSSNRASRELEAAIVGELRRRLGIEPDALVRSAAQVQRIIERNPFPTEAERDPGRFVVVVLAAEPTREDVEALREAIVGRERIACDGAALYAVYPDGQGRSKLTNALIERRLRTRATARNWNTISRIATLLSTP